MKVYDEGLTADIDFVTFSHDGKMDRTELRKEREALTKGPMGIHCHVSLRGRVGVVSFS